MKRFYITLLSALFLLPSYSQTKNVLERDSIDAAYIICQYEYKRIVLIVDNDNFLDDMRLEIGKQMTKFYSYDTFVYDSLSATNEGKQKIRALKREATNKFINSNKTAEEMKKHFSIVPSRHFDTNIYTNYPSGKILAQKRTVTGDWQYEEELSPQDWTIEEDTLSIIGYTCQKATCQWRGRDYIAWFAPDIPINKGPMKFFGLPGLIMKVEDTDHDYVLEIKGIQSTTDKPIYLDKPLRGNEFGQTTRTELAKKEIKYLKNLLRQGNQNAMKHGVATDKERLYGDLMERDYK